MNKGITFYKLQSPYEGDITKNCSLNGVEVDNNFFTLEGRDIKSIAVENTKIVVTLLNGETLEASLCEFTKDLSIDFDQHNGILKLTRNGVETLIDGFVSDCMINNIIESIEAKKAINVDNTLIGNGSPKSPLGISPLYKTGVYKPVLGFFDTTKGEYLPTNSDLTIGDRYVTIEQVSDSGFLYDYNGVKKIACDLISENKGWRIPTKEDWDDMLDAIEPCECDRNHSSAMSNKFLGRLAGKLLKSVDMWRLENIQPSEGTTCNCNEEHHTHCGDCCHTPVTHFHHSCNCVNDPNPNQGVDKFGFTIKPVGYADDTQYSMYYKERSWFWTATNQQFTNVYTKRFDYNKSKVYQDIVGIEHFLSLRLVKDYDGENSASSAEILGSTYPTVLMPSARNGQAIWTATNVAAANPCYNPLAPNNGEGLTTSKRVFINEWKGNQWIRTELKEGEGVVVVNDTQRCTEYRVINGEFVNTNNIISENVVEILQPFVEGLENKIEQEASDRIAADEVLEQKLSDKINETAVNINQTMADFGAETKKAFDIINDVLTTSINTINGGIAAEAQTRQSADEELKNVISQEVADRQAADTALETALNASIENEASERKESDAQLQSLIEQESTERQNSDSELQDAINKEILDRQNADSELQEELTISISKEVADRQAADTALEAALNTSIENEASERKESDANIEKKLLTNNGSAFDAENGVLTLKSVGGDNDIQIQISLNFGEI